MRCRWCGRFVAKSTAMTERVLLVPTLPPSRVAQQLCPECAGYWSIDSSWNRPATERPDLPLEVLS